MDIIPAGLLPHIEYIHSRLKRTYRYSTLRKLRNCLKGRTLHWSLYLVIACFLAGGMLGYHSYLSSFCYVVLLDGKEIGLVSETDQTEQFVRELMGKCSNLYGMPVMPRQGISLSWDYKPGQEVDFQKTKDALRQQISLVTEAVMLTVNSTPVVPVACRDEINKIVETISLAYVSDDPSVKLLEVKLLEEVDGEDCVVPPEQVFTADEAASLLIGQDSGQYMTASRESLLSRSAMGATLDINPGNPVVPVLHVVTVEEATVEQRVPYETTYTYNSSMWSMESKVIVPGRDGKKEVTYRITRENGIEVGREQVSEVITEEPVTQVVEKGTRSKPPAEGTGQFAWPVSGGGRISRGFSGRHIGVDIWDSSGTPVLAADSGVVVKSSWRASQGNYIVIYHGNYWTLYLHNSQNLVSPGQRVSRGQTIAYMGSTGHSTGPHLHFEVRRDNGSGSWSGWYDHTPINPMQFF